jgi:N-acetyl-anhydromuramyl-L-alanine amidase AmpD
VTLAPTIIQLPYTYWTERASAPVNAIVAHNTVGTDSRKYLSQGGPRKVSIHSLIQKDGILYRYVPDERGANHAGYGKMPPGYPPLNPNRCTIGFELENASNGQGRVDPYTEPQLLTMGWEINRIRAKFGALAIFRHADLDPNRRSDTVGLTIPEMEQWAQKAATYYAITKQYRVKHIYISQPSTGGPPYAGELMPGELVTVDKWYTTGYVHLQDGRGFVLLQDLEAI